MMSMNDQQLIDRLKNRLVDLLEDQDAILPELREMYDWIRKSQITEDVMTKSLIDSSDDPPTITPSTGTPAGKIGKADFQKIITGLLVAITGAAIAYFSTEVIPDLESSNDIVKYVLAVVLAAAVNMARKFLTDTRAKE